VVLTAENIRVSYSDRSGKGFTALDVASFAPKPGELTVIAGPSGSGKSTFLHVLSGLLPPQQGTVSFAGKNIYAMGEGRRDAWRRRKIGLVFQDFHLFPELSVLGNVELPSTFGRGGSAGGRELLARLGVPVDRRSIEELSRGEKQRVAIARALAFDPPMIFADEPTASLDDASAREVRKLFRRFAAEGKTVVVVTHDWAMLGEADRTLNLEHGRVAAKIELAPT
jgi:ABC-type lipoprotein export system ATPase subunit